MRVTDDTGIHTRSTAPVYTFSSRRPILRARSFQLLTGSSVGKRGYLRPPAYPLIPSSLSISPSLVIAARYPRRICIHAHAIRLSRPFTRFFVSFFLPPSFFCFDFYTRRARSDPSCLCEFGRALGANQTGKSLLNGQTERSREETHRGKLVGANFLSDRREAGHCAAGNEGKNSNYSGTHLGFSFFFFLFSFFSSAGRTTARAG